MDGDIHAIVIKNVRYAYVQLDLTAGRCECIADTETLIYALLNTWKTIVEFSNAGDCSGKVCPSAKVATGTITE